jgi:hypothetical protein
MLAAPMFNGTTASSLTRRDKARSRGYADALEEATQQVETALRVELIQKAFQKRATGQ